MFVCFSFQNGVVIKGLTKLVLRRFYTPAHMIATFSNAWLAGCRHMSRSSFLQKLEGEGVYIE